MNHELLSHRDRSVQSTQPSSKAERSTQVTTAVLHKLDLDGLPAQQVPCRPKGCWDGAALHFGRGYSHAELQTTKLALKQLTTSSIGWSRWHILQSRPSTQDDSVMIFPACQTSVTPCGTVTSYRCLPLYHRAEVFEIPLIVPLQSKSNTVYLKW